MICKKNIIDAVNNQHFKHLGHSIEEVENLIINQFDYNLIDTKPKTEYEFLQYYANNTDYLYQYLRVVVDNQIFVISNEIRAILGHLSDYNVFPDGTKKDLEKAYGHLRRMNLDAFKILCDRFDDALFKKLLNNSKYDYRDLCPTYIKEFSAKYFNARKLYLQAQEQERTGCDSEVHNIIKLYHNAAKQYIKLKQYCDKNKHNVFKIKMKVKAFKVVAFLIGGISLLSSAITIFY